MVACHSTYKNVLLPTYEIWDAFLPVGWRAYLHEDNQAMMLGIGLYLIPLAMIANPDLIELASAPGAAITSALKIGIGLAAVSYGIIAPNVITLRVVLVALGLAALFVPLDTLGAQP